MKKTSIIIAIFSLLSTVVADYKDDIGYTQLLNELGLNTPDGTGVTAAQIEADLNGATAGTLYQINNSLSPFLSDTITDQSTSAYTDEGISSHSTTVGSLLYGSDSIASGISNIDLYEVNHWLGSGFLNTNQSTTLSVTAPSAFTADVMNHSWVGDASALNTQILRRLDYAIERDDFVAVVGVNNKSNGGDRELLSASYNAISVGTTTNNHESGNTTADGAGRQRPHLVAPQGATSFATPVVGAAAAMLIETARGSAPLANGERSEVVKATLMAGATKDEFPEWSNSSSAPLDAEYGAGELNVYNSYHILTAGEFDPSSVSTVNRQGWDAGSVSSVQENLYIFDLPENFFTELSVALTWNRILTPADNPQTPNPTDVTYDTYDEFLPNLSLQLYEVSDFTVGNLVAESLAAEGNVEYIWMNSLTAGRYAIRVTSDSATSAEYGLALFTETSAVPEPTTAVLLALGLISLMFRRQVC